MKLASIMIAGTAALTIIGSSAFAQEALTGTVTRIDRLKGTVAIQQTQSGTVGAGGGGAAEEFKVQNAASLDTVHAGDVYRADSALTEIALQVCVGLAITIGLEHVRARSPLFRGDWRARDPMLRAGRASLAPQAG